jgi:glycerol-3-phosphate dehydrogenase (NAD(P)+)
VVGAGAFGTALALSCLRSGAAVTLFVRRQELADDLLRNRTNETYLKGIPLPEELHITGNLVDLETVDLILLAVPAQKTPEMIDWINPHLNPSIPLVICSKGIHLETRRLLSDVIQSMIPNRLSVLSGPSFALELAQNLPTAVMIASQDLEEARSIARFLRHDRLRCYATDDRIGVQVAGASKNVIAIASGIVEGKNLGHNAQAALLSRGLAEMMRLGVALGGRGETFMGLAGVGDLFLTGSSRMSRNYSLGIDIGKGKSLSEILGGRLTVTEGVATGAALYHLGKSFPGQRPYTPIIDAVYHLLYEGKGLEETIQDLLSRQSDREF